MLKLIEFLISAIEKYDENSSAADRKSIAEKMMMFVQLYQNNNLRELLEIDAKIEEEMGK